ncbi:hypothetical protein ACFS6H_20000 [Terrimonas rubra]|uniref:Uncharacterized protein n=1 Tax=Terrimonas rubra TaxID=1035890 RepID=A0ABW6A9T6_9BACT
MKCYKCNVSVFTAPLSRVNPTGEDGIFWCDECIKKHEPELYKNLKEDEPDVLKDLKNICYTNKKSK